MLYLKSSEAIILTDVSLSTGFQELVKEASFSYKFSPTKTLIRPKIQLWQIRKKFGFNKES